MKQFLWLVALSMSLPTVVIVTEGAIAAPLACEGRSRFQFSSNEVLESVRNLHRTALDFACKQSETQSAKKPPRKIAEGRYWVGLTGMVIEVKGQQYQFRNEESQTAWKPISELTYIKEGVFKAGDTYWCLSTTMPQDRLAVCSEKGWVRSR